ncbi:hypothetical protein ElyMa_001609000 [Elysia marginata]|uniref:Uncharacterized protein n=1 Tax=Elysia marginata TaxID=1093978 RepID=A0AAV4JI73_9GAST|nr:hypothetical protein ElyMa_001609000 [Elysia marginata]
MKEIMSSTPGRHRKRGLTCTKKKLWATFRVPSKTRALVLELCASSRGGQSWRVCLLCILLQWQPYVPHDPAGPLSWRVVVQHL